MTDDLPSPKEFDFGESDEEIARRVLAQARIRRKPLAEEHFAEFARHLGYLRERYEADKLLLDDDGSASAVEKALTDLSGATAKLRNWMAKHGGRNFPGRISLRAAAERANERQAERIKSLNDELASVRKQRRQGPDNNFPEGFENTFDKFRKEKINLEKDLFFFEDRQFEGVLHVLEQASRLIHDWSEEALNAGDAPQQEIKKEEGAQVRLDQSDCEGRSPEHRLIRCRLPALYGRFFGYEGVGTSRALNKKGEPDSPSLRFVMAVLDEFGAKSNRGERFSPHTVSDLLEDHRRRTGGKGTSK